MRFKNLKTKFVVYIISLILFIAFSFLSFYIYRSNTFLREQLTDFGFHLARDLSYASEFAIASEDPVLLQPSFDGIFHGEDVVLVTAYNKNGYIIASKKKVEIEEKIPLDIITKLLREKKALKTKDYTKKGEEIYSFYSPVLTTETLLPAPTEVKELIGFVRVALSLEKLAAQNKQILGLGTFMTSLIVLSGIFISIFLAGSLTQPINLLRQGVETIAKGNLDHRIKIETGDEIEQLADEFNLMTKNLKESREKLKKRIHELERFHKLTVGRELKMIELKKKIKELEKKLEKPKGRK